MYMRKSGMKRLLHLSILLMVATQAHLVAASFHERVVASVIVLEAGGEGPEGMRAVAEVIRNRAINRKADAFSVVTRPRAFSVTNGGISRMLRKAEIHPRYQEAARLAKMIHLRFSGLGSTVGGADHFKTVGTPAYWAKGHKPVRVIGRMEFYRLRK